MKIFWFTFLNTFLHTYTQNINRLQSYSWNILCINSYSVHQVLQCSQQLSRWIPALLPVQKQVGCVSIPTGSSICVLHICPCGWSHAAVISMIPHLVLIWADESSVVSKHVSYVHYYCIETVILISLETISIFWLSCSKNVSAECFRKGDFVVEFPGETIIDSESFQVDTQNRRQWDKFHFMSGRLLFITPVTVKLLAVRQLLQLEKRVDAAFQGVFSFTDCQRKAEKRAGRSVNEFALWTHHLGLYLYLIETADFLSHSSIRHLLLTQIKDDVEYFICVLLSGWSDGLTVEAAEQVFVWSRMWFVPHGFQGVPQLQWDVSLISPIWWMPFVQYVQEFSGGREGLKQSINTAGQTVV